MNVFVEPLRARFGGLVADMSPRDRALFLGLVLFAYLGVLGVAGWGGNALLRDVQSRIATKQAALTRLEAMEGEYVANSAKVVEIEASMRANGKQDFTAYAEKAAQKTGVATNLKAVREKGSTTEGNLIEKTYTVDLEKVTLGQLTDFLFEVEANGYPLRVRTARLKTTGPAGQRLLGASFEVATYKLDESEAPAAEGGAN